MFIVNLCIAMRHRMLLILLVNLSTPALCWITWHVATTNEPVIATTTPLAEETPPINKTEESVDILKLLNVSSATPGVSVLQGSAQGFPAYKFRLTFDQVQLPNPDIIGRALTKARGFTIVFVYRQHRKSLGTLLSVNSPGRVNPWFQMTSNLRTGQLVLHYRITTDAKLHQVSWFLQPTSKNNHPKGGFGWTHLALTLDAEARIWSLSLNCNAAIEQPFAGTAHSRLQVPEDSLAYFRQEPGFKKKFLGAMKVAKILPFTSRNVQSFWLCSAKNEPKLSPLT